MKSIACYIMGMIISMFVFIDTIISLFKEIPRNSDIFIDPARVTSSLNFTLTGQLIILGISAVIVIIGAINDKR